MNKAEIIVALDVPNAEAMEAKLQEMPDFIEWYKVGLEIFCAEGPAVLEPLKRRNKKIFLDLKLHDIPRTVGNAVKTAAAHGVNLMTVHAIGGRAMLEEAAKAAAKCENPPKLVAVTTLTSLSQEDFVDLGISRTVSEQAVELGRLCMASGIDGMVTSAHEAKALREAFPDALLVVPGIRMPEGDVGDQKRVASPSFAVEQGATHLVIGRPILQAEDPSAAATAMLNDMNK
ncbi:orotidine-5'-phosphate decarboxylase [Pontiella sulfatireligans]|uniref:Orotidine 5'-phosphate decarboxylase n=1 Tax=Pontiella sulfatireligans TaxID=2750658 RepID=A0A6C2UI23_9BACT|nr:orotidine-5'-phosphate decarboxylase [Pontiella sulfatireligans]VGO19778.1 Orotidine 5'-phosphate decarboxylase [Pontiella sulfatireligans]